MPNLFNFLPGEGRALTIIRSLVAAGNPLEAIQSAILESGIVIRPEMVAGVTNYLQNLKSVMEEYLPTISSFELPDISKIPLSMTTQLRNFSYLTKVTGFSTATREPVTQYVRVSSSNLLTLAQASENAANIVEGIPNKYGVEPVSATVESITQNNAGLTPLDQFGSLSNGESNARALEQIYGFGHGIF